MFEESLASQRIRPGQILTGRVIEVGPDVVVVSAGLKSEAVIPTAQFKNERGRSKSRPATTSRSHSTASRTVPARRASHARRQSVPAPGSA